jgi:hypothetical protein
MKEDERPESTEGNIWMLQKELGGLDESTNTFQNSFSIRAVANLWGAVNDTNLIDREEQIPVMSFHGDTDKIVPCDCDYPFTDLDTAWTSSIVCKLYGSRYIHKRLTNQGIHSELVIFPGAGHEPQYETDKYSMVMDTITKRVRDFYFRSLFNFPEITGPARIPVNMPPPAYSLPYQEDITYYWQAQGGKIIPGTLKNQARVAWLAEGSGKIILVMVHKNQANVELDLPVILPEKLGNYYTVRKR